MPFVVSSTPPYPWPDIAIIEVEEAVSNWLRLAPAIQDTGFEGFYWGFPLSLGNQRAGKGSDVKIASIDPLPGDSPGRFWYEVLQVPIRSGASGSPVVDPANGEVMGVLVATRSERYDRGGHIIPVYLILDEIPELLEAVEQDAAALSDAPTAFSTAASPIAMPSVPRSSDSLLGTQTDTSTSDALLASIKELARSGKAHSAATALQSFISGPGFDSLPNDEAKSAYLRLCATLTLVTTGDPDAAQPLVDRARAFSPASMNILDARMLSSRGDSAGALALLAGHELEADTFRATLLYLELRPDDALSEARAAIGRHGDDADLLRIAALSALGTGAQRVALDFVRRSRAAHPNNPQTLWALAVILFYARVPTPLIPKSADGPPTLLAPDMLLSDDFAMASAREAADLMTEALSAIDARSEQRRVMEVWRLATLVLADRIADARSLAKILVAADPPNEVAVPWILTFDLGVDLEPWVARTKATIADGRATLDEILAFAQLAILRKDGAEAQRVCAENAARFISPGEKEVLRATQARALAVERRYDAALDTLGDSGDPSFRESLRNAKERQEGKDVRPRLIAEYRESGDVTRLLDAVEFALIDRDWAFAADFAAELVERMPTPQVILVGLTALYNAQRYGDWRRLYDAQSAAVLDQVDADRLATMRVTIEWRGGDRSTAIDIAKRRAEQQPSDANLYTLGYLQEQQADVHGLGRTAELALSKGSDEARIYLAFSSWLEAADPELAGRLWDQAERVGIPDPLVPLALSLAHQLGRADRTAPLMEALPGLVGTGAVTTATYDDLVKIVKASRERSGELNARYRAGTIPVHTLAEGLRLPLFQTHWAIPRDNGTRAATQWTTVYIRHGTRLQIDAERVAKAPEIALDLTSILLLDDLELLGVVESRWPKIIVPRNLGELIQETIRQYASNQPAVDAARDDVLRLIDSRALKVFEAPLDPQAVADPLREYDEAEKRDAIVIDWGPVRSGSFEVLDPQPEVVLRRALDPWTLTELLKELGEISSSQAVEALQSLGAQRPEAPAQRPAIRDREILIASNLPEWMQRAGLLEPLLRIASVSMDQAHERRLRSDAEASARTRRLAERAQNLRGHVSDRLRDGRYVAAIPATGYDLPLQTSEDAVSGLFSVLAADVSSDAALVVDDRWATRMSQRDQGPIIVGTNELLAALEYAGIVTRSKKFDVLLQMRRQGLFFIPLRHDEILQHVGSPPIVDDVLVESEELRTLRRYIGVAVAHLHSFGEGEPGASESVYLLALSHEIRLAILLLFDANKSGNDVRAEWVFRNLWFDDIAKYSALKVQMASLPDIRIADVAAAGFIVNALEFQTEDDRDAAKSEQSPGQEHGS